MPSICPLGIGIIAQLYNLLSPVLVEHKKGSTKRTEPFIWWLKRMGGHDLASYGNKKRMYEECTAPGCISFSLSGETRRDWERKVGERFLNLSDVLNLPDVMNFDLSSKGSRGNL